MPADAPDPARTNPDQANAGQPAPVEASGDARFVIEIAGPDARDFLQGLITNDMRHTDQGPIYAAMLSPQGKYLADFFVIPRPGGGYLIDAAAAQGPALAARLGMYRLRADVTVTPSALGVARGTGPAPAGAVPDPRHPALGWRLYGAPADLPGPDGTDWDALRVAQTIPQSGVELVENDSYILEMGFERLNGVDFRKGCYVGQEVTARMKHKTTLKKGLVRVAIDGSAAPGTPILTDDGRPAGTLYTQSGPQALAYLRLDRADGPLSAGDATITVPPDPAG